MKPYIQKYPCTCHESGICFIARHPDLRPPVSFSTEKEARDFMHKELGVPYAPRIELKEETGNENP